MLSSKGDDKHEVRFAARIDVLTERVDMLASTIATTASAIAKKDGEIAALQRAFESRDETLRALVQHANRTAEAPAADAPVDATELRSLRNSVAALAKERANGVNAEQIQRLVATLRTLDERVAALSAAAATPPVPATDPATTARIDALTADLSAVQTALLTEEQLDGRFGQTERVLDGVSRRLDSLAAQLSRVDALTTTVGGLERARSADAEQVDRRLEATDETLAKLSLQLTALDERLGGIESGRALQDERLDRRFEKTDHALADLSQRLEALPSLDEGQLEHRFQETDDALATLARRLEGLGETLGRLEQARAVEAERLDRHVETTKDALTGLSEQVGELQSVDRDELERRFGETDRVLGRLTQRLDTLAETVESAAASLDDKEHELASLQLRFTESSARIESIVDDIRAALHAFPVPSTTSLDDLATRLERIETGARKATESSARVAGELSGRIDLIDQRVATVAEEVSRAKTLWPVALRSLEARLDDAVHGRRPEPGVDPVSDAHAPDQPADDLIAGVRESLQAMETVAAEMARAADALGEPDEAQPPATDPDPSTRPAEPEHTPAAATGGATIVPLRAGEP